jgi:hypothetical protein
MNNRRDGHKEFVHFGSFKPLLEIWFCVIEVSISFWFIWVLVSNLLKFDGICAITIDVKYMYLKWPILFFLFKVFDTTPLNLITSLEIRTYIEFYISSRKNG